MENPQITVSDPDDPTLQQAVEQFLTSGEKSGKYKSNSRHILNGFIEFVGNRGITTVSNLTPKILALYADTLNNSSELGAASVWTYFDTVSAFLEYASRWGWVDENYAKTAIARAELPKRPSPGSSDQQFWTPDARRDLVEYVDGAVSTAIEQKGLSSHIELRNQVFVYLLAYSGVRGGEILHDPRDDRRNGLKWGDVSIEDSIITVLGKSQNRETTGLPKQLHSPLKQLHRVVQPSDDWPVIFSNHAPTFYRRLPDEFDPADSSGESLLDYCRETGTVPPALSTNGGRNLMKRLCEKADVDIDGEYLKPHGGRRGVGDKLYRERGSVSAQRALRHSDPKITSNMYSHVKSGEVADDLGDVFDSE